MKTLVIEKEALKQNIETIKTLAQKETQPYEIIGVVKGNGYGLGLIQYSKFLIENGIKTLAVATFEEALDLRIAEIESDILMLSSTSIYSEAEELVKNNIIITIGSKETATIANDLAEKGYNIRAHIKIDTGFGRYGFIYQNSEEIIKTIKELNQNIKVEGIFSHFSLAYYKNSKSVVLQFERFESILEKLKENDINIRMAHICNSPAFFNFENMRLDAARIGSAFTGRVTTQADVKLNKIGKLKVNITEIKTVPKGFNISYLDTYKTKKETKLAVIPLGYMDGFNIGQKPDMFKFVNKLRRAKNAFKTNTLKVTINGKIYDIIGTIGMYHSIIDITNSDVKINDEAYVDINPIFVNNNIRREFI